jgi:transposase
MWEPFRRSLEQWVPKYRIIYDRFHILQHASQAADEVRRAEFFGKGGAARDLVRSKRWLLLTSWLSLDRGKRRHLNGLFALNQCTPNCVGSGYGETSRMLLDHLEAILNTAGRRYRWE